MDGALLASSVATLRLISGWACCSIGVLGLVMGIDTGPGTTDGSYLLFHLVLLVAGLVLLALGYPRRRPGRVACAAAGFVALAGLVLSALPRTEIVCCFLDYPVRHGYPFTFLAGGAGRHHFSPWHAVTDLLFWLCLGLFVLTAVTLATRRREQGPAIRHAVHAEHRAAGGGREEAAEVRGAGDAPARRQP